MKSGIEFKLSNPFKGRKEKKIILKSSAKLLWDEYILYILSK